MTNKNKTFNRQDIDAAYTYEALQLAEYENMVGGITLAIRSLYGFEDATNEEIEEVVDTLKIQTILDVARFKHFVNFTIECMKTCASVEGHSVRDIESFMENKIQEVYNVSKYSIDIYSNLTTVLKTLVGRRIVEKTYEDDGYHILYRYIGK